MQAIFKSLYTLLALESVEIGSLFGLFFLGQSLDDLLFLGLETLFPALAGFLGLGAASFSLITVGGGSKKSEVKRMITIAHYPY